MKLFLKVVAFLIFVYWFVAYAAAPFFWKHYENQRELENEPKWTRTAEGIQGDPLNVGFVGTPDEILKALKNAGWAPADRSSFRSDLKIATGVLFKRSYPTAPVSLLYLYSRPQDMAFEKEVGDSPSQRHHVRLWQTALLIEGRSLWLGAATFDKGIGVNRNTGKFTHHIDANIDQERDLLMNDLRITKQLSELYQVTGRGPSVNDYNGSHDRYYTDGEMTIGWISPGNHGGALEIKPNPVGIKMKNSVYSLFKNWVPKAHE